MAKANKIGQISKTQHRKPTNTFKIHIFWRIDQATKEIRLTSKGQNAQPKRHYPDPPAAKFAGDVRRWAHRRTLVRQAPTNKADSVKSAALKGQKNEEKANSAYGQAR
jgi:hypothetical protein